jgi:hypothetical protein
MEVGPPNLDRGEAHRSLLKCLQGSPADLVVQLMYQQHHYSRLCLQPRDGMDRLADFRSPEPWCQHLENGFK